jgi:hypothetical protein
MSTTALDGALEADGTLGIDRALDLGGRLISATEVFAAGLGLPDLGVIDLPPVIGSAADQARLRAVAPLYLAAELESAQLLPAVELLAGLFAGGGLSADVGPAAPLLAAFWTGRNHRFSAGEREAFFARLFGTPGPALATRDARNTAFEPLMVDLTEALTRLEPSPLAGPLPPSEAPARAIAGALADNLSARGGGMVPFAARDILATINAAVRIIEQAPLQRAVGAHSAWGAVGQVAARWLGRPDAAVAAHVARGRAGMLVLAWLAEVAPSLEAGAPLLGGDRSVLAAAVGWLQASLSVHERNPAG